MVGHSGAEAIRPDTGNLNLIQVRTTWYICIIKHGNPAETGLDVDLQLHTPDMSDSGAVPIEQLTHPLLAIVTRYCLAIQPTQEVCT